MSLCCPQFHPLRQFARQLKLGAKVAGSVDQLAFCGHRIRRWEKLSACKYYYLRRKSVSWISDGIWLPEQHLSQDNFWFPECWPLHPGAGTQPFDGHVCGQVPRYRGAHVLRGMELETICIKSDAGVGCYKQIIRNLNHWKAGTSYTSNIYIHYANCKAYIVI
jgi:hypothetical protein